MRMVAWGDVSRGAQEVRLVEDAALAEADPEATFPGMRLTLDGVLPGGSELRRPAALVVRKGDGEVVTDAPALDLHAFGDDADGKLTNLRARMVAHPERLEEREERPARPPHDQRNLLQGLLSRPTWQSPGCRQRRGVQNGYSERIYRRERRRNHGCTHSRPPCGSSWDRRS